MEVRGYTIAKSVDLNYSEKSRCIDGGIAVIQCDANKEWFSTGGKRNMAEKIRAEEGAIEKGAAAVENARLGIDNRIKDIESKMAELGSFWSGDAANSFNTLMMSWQEKASRPGTAFLTICANNLRGTAKDQADKRGKTTNPARQSCSPCWA